MPARTELLVLGRLTCTVLAGFLDFLALGLEAFWLALLERDLLWLLDFDWDLDLDLVAVRDLDLLLEAFFAWGLVEPPRLREDLLLPEAF